MTTRTPLRLPAGHIEEKNAFKTDTILQPSLKERILAMGASGAGKSYQVLRIAQALAPTGANFYILDTDGAYQIMLRSQFPNLKNVYPVLTTSWEDFVKWGKEALRVTTPNDWIVVDMIDVAWQSVQRYFIGQVFQQEMGAYFLQARESVQGQTGQKEDEEGKDNKKRRRAKSIFAEGLSGWMDWPVINRLYDDWFIPLVYKNPGHLYFAAKIQKLSDDDDASVRSLFGSWGVRPAGQKYLSHQVHTVWLYVKEKKGWSVSTIKDRRGAYFDEEKLISIYHQYLLAQADWPALKEG